MARIPARFAVDLISGAGTDATPPNAAPVYNGFSREVLAVADGVVVRSRDGAPDQPPGVSRTPQPLPLDDASGNYVVLDIGGGRFVVYEHLQEGSARVMAGDRVRRGQVIAGLGSSGSTSIGYTCTSTSPTRGTRWRLKACPGPSTPSRATRLRLARRADARRCVGGSNDANVSRERELPAPRPS